MSITTMDSESWFGRTLIDGDDRKLGTIEAIYLDAQTGRPQWMSVKTGRWGTKHNFVPLADATPVEDAIRTPYAKSQIDDAPRLAADEELADDRVVELYRHYGLAYDRPADGDDAIVERDEVLPATASATQPEQDMLVSTGREPELAASAAVVPRTQGEDDLLVATGREPELAAYVAVVPRTQGEEDMLVATGQIVPRRAA